MGLPIPIPSAEPLLRALPTVRPNPFVTVPSGITQAIAPPAKILMQLPPRLPPLNLAPIGNFFRIGGLIALPAAIVDLIGQAGAYQWRDNLLNQINGGNSSLVAGKPPFEGGQMSVLYEVGRALSLDGNPWGDQYFAALGGKIGAPYLDGENWYFTYNSGLNRYLLTPTTVGNKPVKITRFYVRRYDGLPDTGGNPLVAPNGEDSFNPFLVPPTVAPPPYEFPSYNPPLKDPLKDPSKNPSKPPLKDPLKDPSKNPSKPPLKDPLKDPSKPPLKDPFKNPSNPPLKDPFKNPSNPPLKDPLKDPFKNPSNPPIPKPVEINKFNISITNIINNQIINNYISLNLNKEAEQIKEKNRLRKKENCCPPEFVSISVKKFDRCSNENKPEFSFQIISVLKGTESLNQSLFEEIANAQALQCNPIEAVAAVPEWWQIRPEGKRPQIVFQFCSKVDGKYSSPKFVITLPHPKNTKKPLSPIIDKYRKGNFEGELKLADNSKIIVNCENQKEAERLLNILAGSVSERLLTGSTQKFSERRGKPIKKEELFCRIATYFENGIQDSTSPKWKKKFELPS